MVSLLGNLYWITIVTKVTLIFFSGHSESYFWSRRRKRKESKKKKGKGKEMEKGKGEGEGKGKRKVKKKTKRKRKNGEGKGKKEKEEKRKRKKDNNRQWERKEEKREEREGKRREKNELIKLEWAGESQQSSPSTRGTSCTRACLTTRKCVGHVLREEGSDWSRMWSPWKASIVLHPEGSPLPSAEQHPGIPKWAHRLERKRSEMSRKEGHEATWTERSSCEGSVFCLSYTSPILTPGKTKGP